MKKFLVFDRPFTRGFTREYVRVGPPGVQFRYVSDFRYRDDVDLIGRQYRVFYSSEQVSAEIEEILSDVVPRDRFLRSLDPALSSRLGYAAYIALSEILDEEQPDVVLGLPIDNYYLHILEKLCRARGIYALFPIQSFLPNRTRVSNLGEWRFVQEPSDVMVEEYYERLLNRSFKPTTLSPHRRFHKLLRLYGREISKKVLFETLKIVKRDPYSFHYNGIFPAKWAITIHSPKNLFADKFFETRQNTFTKIISAKNAGKRIVFLPLQFSPETTVDYYISDINFSRYDDLMHVVISNIPDDVVLVVKEHPDIYGFRNPKFYEKFMRKENVILSHVSLTVSELMEVCPFVVVTGGASTGAEAVVKGNTVLALGGAYYGGNELHEIKNWHELPDWGKRLVTIENDENDRRNFVRRILANTLDGPYAFVRPSRSMIDTTHANIARLLEYVERQLG